MFQILCITERGARLSVSNGRASIRKDSQQKESFIPLDDLDAVVIEENAVTLTGSILAQLAEKRIPVILCGKCRFPAAILQPLILNGAESHLMLRSQIAASLPWKKQIWQKLVRSKIAGQSENLLRRGKLPVSRLIPLVRSGDPDNVEGRAAAFYWSRLHFFPVRNRHAQDANCLFNYAYTILFSAFARYLCAAAVNPDIGIHHHGKYNHFPLASDLMEPFRPLVDRAVFQLIDADPEISELLPGSRRTLLELLFSAEVRIRRQRFRLFDAVNETVHSFKRSLLQKDASILLLPEPA